MTLNSVNNIPKSGFSSINSFTSQKEIPQEFKREAADSSPDWQNDSWLKGDLKPSKGEFNLQLFANESCSPFITGTTIQGISLLPSLERFFNCLEASDAEKKYLKMLPLLKDAFEITKEMSQISKIEDKDKFLTATQSLADKLHNQVANLKSGEEILIPSGWVANQIEFPVLFLIKKEKDGTFTLSVYNTHSGTEYHESKVVNGQLLTNPCYKVGKIKSKDLCQNDFFQALIEFKTLPFLQPGLKFSETHLYVGLIAPLKGKVVKTKNGNDSRFMVKPKLRGSSSFDIIFGYIKSSIISEGNSLRAKNLALDDFHKIKFAYRKQSLIDVCNHFFNSETKWTRSEHKLIQSHSAKLARKAARLHQAGLISDKEYKACACTQLDVKEKLKAKKQAAKKVEMAPLNYLLNEKDQIQAKNVISEETFTCDSQNVLGKKIVLPKFPESPEIQPQKISPGKILDTLTNWVDQLESFALNDQVHKDHLHAKLNQLMYTLPLPKETDFWDLLQEDQITPCLEQLFKLSRLYFGKNEAKYFENVSSPKSIIGNHIALAIGEYIARRKQGNKLANHTLDYRQLIAFSQTPSAVLVDPLDKQKLQGLLKAIAPQGFDFSKHYSRKKIYDFYEGAIFSFDSRIIIKENKKQFDIYKKFFQSSSPEMIKRGHAKASVEEKIALMLSESVEGQNLLPADILYLRQLALFSDGIFSRSNHQTSLTKEWKYTAKYDERNNCWEASLFWMPGNEKLYISSMIDFQDMKSKIQLSSLPYFNKPNKASKRPHFGMNGQNAIMASQIKEENRDELIIDSVKNDELARVLSYYQDRPEALFEDPTEQYFFATHLLRTGNLMDQLIHEPRMALKLMSFINNRQTFFQSCDKKEPAIYFCKIGHYCRRYIEFIQKERPESFKDLENELKGLLLDYRMVVLKDILPSCRTIEERNKLYQHLLDFSIGSNTETVDHNHIVDMAKDYFTAKIHGPIALAKGSVEDSKQKLWKPKVVKEFFNSIMPKFREMLETDLSARNQILNGILESLKLKPYDLKWEGEFPRFESGPFIIDLIEFKVSENGKIAANLPSKLLDDPYSYLLFDQISEVQVNDNGTFIVHDSHGITEVKVQISKNQPFIAKRWIDGVEYTFVPFDQFLTKYRNAFSYKLINKKNTSIWLSLEQPNPHYLIKQEKQVGDKKERDFWIFLKEEKNNQYSIEAVTDDPNKKRILINPSSQSFAPFKNFEDFAYTAFWTNSSVNFKQVTEIEMKRLGLRFDVSKDIDGTLKAWSRDVPGYYLSNDQKIDFGSQWPSYLVLQNTLGQKKILMVNRVLDPSHSPMTPFDMKIQVTMGSSKRFLVYDLEEIEGAQRLKASCVRDALYLAHMMLAKKNYKSADFYLEKSISLGIFSKKENQLIRTMLSYAESDRHPDALVLSCRALLLSEQNRLKYDPSYHLDYKNCNIKNAKISFKSDLKSDWYIASRAYAEYLQNIKNVRIKKLSLEEEKALLRLFITHNVHMSNPVILQRIEELALQPKKSKEISVLKNSMQPQKVKLRRGIFYAFMKAFTKNEKGIAFGKQHTPTPLSQFLTDMSEMNFLENFSVLYEKAQSGNVATRRHLFNILQLFKANSLNKDSEALFLVQILESVLERPKSFPSSEEVRMAMQSNRDIQASQFFNTRILPRINKRAFSFKGLLTSIKNFLYNVKMGLRFNPKLFKEFLLAMPSEFKDRTFGKLPLTADLKALDQSDDAFFDEVLKKYFTCEEKKVEEGAKIEEVPKDPLSKAFFEEMIKNLEEFYSVRHQTKNLYHLIPGKDLTELANSLAKSLDFSSENLKTKEKQLLALINKPSLQNFYGDVLAQASNQKPALSLSQAVDLFEQGNLSKYQQFTNLDHEEIIQFENLMTSYLVASTRSEQAFRIYNHIQVFLKLPEGSDEKKILVQKLGEEITNRRHYSNVNQGQQAHIRSFLVFELRNKLMLRKKQVDTIEKIYNHPNRAKLMQKLILQLGTGYGKSKVLASLFEWISRMDGELVINLWPSALYPVNKYDMKRQVESTFHQRSDTLDFDRSTSTDIFHLTFTEREIKDAKLEGRQLNARPESLQCVELKFLETLFNASKKDLSAFEGKINSFQNSLQEIKKAEVHFDEVHITLATNKEVNFTVGNPSVEPSENILLIEEIFRFLTQDPEVVALMNIKGNQQYLVTKETITNDICPRLAKHMIGLLGITKAQEQEFLDYVMEKSDGIPNWVHSHPRKEQIGLLKGNLSRLLPDMLYKKVVNVHYGLSKKQDGAKYAKPYEASDSPVENADYDLIHEALGKTYLTYLHVRLTVDKMLELTQHLQASALSESKRRLIDIKETKAYKFYSQHFPPEVGELFTVDRKRLETFQNKINEEDELVFYYLRTFVTPTLKKYAYKLKSDSQNLRSQVGRVIAMTATPGNSAKYGLESQFQPDLGSDEQVLDCLEKKCKDPKTMHILSTQTAKEFLDAIFKDILVGSNNYRAIIDLGALFKGMNSQYIAEQLLAHFAKENPEIQGIVFFHEDRLFVLEAGLGLIPYEQCHLNPKQLFTFYDHKHAFGSDVKQFSEAKALCTFSNHTTKDEIIQGVGRMRELLKDQTVEWATMQEVVEAISIPKNHQFAFGDLRNLSYENHAHQEADELYQSLKQQIRNDVRSVLMDKLIFAKSEKEALSLFKDFSSVLIEKVEMEAFKLYGGMPEERTDAEDLIFYRNELLKLLSKMKKLSKTEKAKIKKQLLSYDASIEKLKSKLSDEKKRHLTKVGIEAEIQQQVQTKVDTRIEVKSSDEKSYDKNVQKLKATQWRKDLDLYESNWIKTAPANLLRIKQIVGQLIHADSLVFSFVAKAPLKLLGNNPLAIPLVAATAVVALPILLGAGAISLAAKGGMKLLNMAINRGGGVLLYDASAIVQSVPHRKASAAHSFFKNRPGATLLMTNNFVAVTPTTSKATPVKPLSKEQKSLYEVLVIEEEVGGKKALTVIMGDQSADAQFWRKKLEEDLDTDLEGKNRKRKICLYDLNIGIVQNGKNAFNEQELRENPVFQELIVKAKLYNGDVTYTDKEEAILAKLTENPKVRNKIRTFFNEALVWHGVKKSKFKDSPAELVLSAGFMQGASAA